MTGSGNEVNGVASQQRGSRTTLVIGGIVIVALIAVAAIVLSAGEVETLDPGSPEGVVQAYLQATIDGDDETAHSYLAAELRESCEPVSELRSDPDNARVRVVLREVSFKGVTALVEVAITEGEAAFGDGGWTHDETFWLEGSGDSWVITGAPWPYYGCGFR
ncbi:MAG: hypothetical protein BMS9Abin07_0767 [Acidimicrobiia bacterium]|nr:MAG: hypothetical protein BMS9Abin07_0767 [Acidimicrobiia bacterium]